MPAQNHSAMATCSVFPGRRAASVSQPLGIEVGARRLEVASWHPWICCGAALFGLMDAIDYCPVGQMPSPWKLGDEFASATRSNRRRKELRQHGQ